MSTTDAHALVGAYVLDALDDVERAAFDRHLRDCAECRSEVAELRETAARLADVTWSVPPPRLRAGVLAAISRTRQLAPGGPARGGRYGGASRWRRAMAAAAAAVVLAGGAATATWVVQDHRVRAEKALAEAAQRREAQIRAIVSAPDVVVRSGPVTGGGTVTVASSGLHDAAVIVFGADAAPAGGRVYQLWALRGTTPTSAGVLAIGEISAIRIVNGLPGSSTVGVTVEPPGGSATPTLPMVAAVNLA